MQKGVQFLDALGTYHCDACHAPLGQTCVLERRQVFDLPVLRSDVIEHRVLQAQCRCGKVHRGRFPDLVGAAVQYGPRAQAVAVRLNQHHMVPLKRTADLMREFFGLAMSQTQIIRASAQAASLLRPTVQAIAQAFLNQPTVHADETGLRINKALYWMHTMATNELTWVGQHAKRGLQAVVDFDVLPRFKGTLVHDGLASYRKLGCTHGLCNAHHLRELTNLAENFGQAWAGAMIELLTDANDLDHSRRAAGPIDYEAPEYRLELSAWRSRYDALLDEGDRLNPRVQPSDKCGRPKQSKATNLIARLREHADDVWRFMSQPDVPFTNNLAEQAVRMSKVKQKISGCWRTIEGRMSTALSARTWRPCTSRGWTFWMNSPTPSGDRRLSLPLVDGWVWCILCSYQIGALPDASAVTAQAVANTRTRRK